MTEATDPAGAVLFIANRGEIAVRINRAAQTLGMQVVQAHSEADADMLAVRMADRAVQEMSNLLHKSSGSGDIGFLNQSRRTTPSQAKSRNWRRR